MSEETEVLTVEGLAKLLGRTEASIREGIRRGVPWLGETLWAEGNRYTSDGSDLGRIEHAASSVKPARRAIRVSFME